MGCCEEPGACSAVCLAVSQKNMRFSHSSDLWGVAIVGHSWKWYSGSDYFTLWKSDYFQHSCIRCSEIKGLVLSALITDSAMPNCSTAERVTDFGSSLISVVIHGGSSVTCYNIIILPWKA